MTDKSRMATEEEKLDLNAPKKFNPSFIEWAGSTQDASARAAWAFKENQIKTILDEWNDSVMYGRDQLKQTIDDLVKANHDLKIQLKLKEEPIPGQPVIEITRG